VRLETSGQWENTYTSTCTKVRVISSAPRMGPFRYLVDGERWENDWAADAYVPNPFGGEDSVVEV